MSLALGSRLGPYEIIQPIGAGESATRDYRRRQLARVVEEMTMTKPVRRERR